MGDVDADSLFRRGPGRLLRAYPLDPSFALVSHRMVGSSWGKAARAMTVVAFIAAAPGACTADEPSGSDSRRGDAAIDGNGAFDSLDVPVGFDGTGDGSADAVNERDFGPLDDVPGRGAELCGDGLDQDRNGTPDDGCPCVPGVEQACFIGDPVQAGIGRCSYGRQRCVANGAMGMWGPCEGSGRAAPESCDGRDNDCDGEVDEDCPCTTGQSRACYTGPDGTAGVGVCQQGTQSCGAPGSPSTWGRCTGSVVPADEICDGRDNDCDGRLENPRPEVCDGVDNNCDGRVDEDCLCAGGLTAVFRRVAPPMTRGASPSGILPPSAAPIFAMTCEPNRCAMGEVAVQVSTDRPMELQCVRQPMPCRNEERYDFVAGVLTCVPCAMVIQYGAIFSNTRVCAPRPMVTCRPGDVPTWLFEIQRWDCRPLCDNRLYDQAAWMGMTVCIPC